MLRARHDNHWQLELSGPARHLYTADRVKALEAALAVATGEAVSLELTVADAALADAPAQRDADALRARQVHAEQAVAGDPVVEAFTQQFGARLRPGSIQPPQGT